MRTAAAAIGWPHHLQSSRRRVRQEKICAVSYRTRTIIPSPQQRMAAPALLFLPSPRHLKIAAPSSLAMHHRAIDAMCRAGDRE
jgi:hypothetical protein